MAAIATSLLRSWLDEIAGVRMDQVNRSDGEPDDDPRWIGIRHELGNVSLLIDAVARVSVFDEDGQRLLADAKRRIDALIDDGWSTDA